MTYATIRDARTGQPITGKILREYSNGLTVEDVRGVIHYASSERVLERSTVRARITTPRLGNGDLFHD